MELTLETKNYFEDLFDRKFEEKFEQKFEQKFEGKFEEKFKDLKRHNQALAESFRHDVKAMTEQLPTRTEVREIVKEEIDLRLEPIESDIRVIKIELQDINRTMNNHEHRIVRLEETVLE